MIRTSDQSTVCMYCMHSLKHSWEVPNWLHNVYNAEGSGTKLVTWSFNGAQCEMQDWKWSWTTCSHWGSLEQKLNGVNYRQNRKTEFCNKLPLLKSSSSLQASEKVILSVSNTHMQNVERKCCGSTYDAYLVLPGDQQMHRPCSPGRHYNDQSEHCDNSTCAWYGRAPQTCWQAPC